MANWYAYKGTGDPLLNSSYRLVTTKPLCTIGGCTICAIYLNQTAATPPAIEPNVLQYIANSLVSLIPQPADGSKRFVYVKC